MNELFSMEPQKAVLSEGHVFTVYDAAVLPQYPFTSHIRVASSHEFPAGVEPAQRGIIACGETHIVKVWFVGIVAKKWCTLIQ
jgi:hypothetical protein